MKITQSRTVLLYAGSGYALVACRFIGTFILRLIVDPAVVGIINFAQLGTPIYSALTLGASYTALRNIPGKSFRLQVRIMWLHIASNMLEALFVLAPFIVVVALLIDSDVQGYFLLVLIIGLYSLTQRFFGIFETMIMSFPLPVIVVYFRGVNILILCISLLAAKYFGALGFLIVSPFIGLILIWVAVNFLPFPKLNLSATLKRIKSTQYGRVIGLEKILSATAASLDGIFVGAFLGPVSLAGYYLGVSVRGAFGTMMNSLFWALWPNAVKAHNSSSPNIFSSKAVGISIGLFAAINTIFLGKLVEWLILHYLPRYIDSISTILIIVSSIGPIVYAEWGKARLVVEGRPHILPWTSISRAAIFLLILYITSFFMTISIQCVAYSSFISLLYCMVIILSASSLNNIGRINFLDVLVKVIISTIPLIFFMLQGR